ncbi:hypothetical protein [Pseudarthrobacter sp. NPDC058119]|uniref:hypothetical protein n=1 Tax=Pseudarthrobacter sp. NPDC058119 TaxID=3346348 RepID=UPI0036DD2999
MSSETGSTNANSEAVPGTSQDPAVLDPDAQDPDAEEKLRLQLAIFDVSRDAEGRSLEEIRDTLLSAFAARGVAAPPATWVESVASSAFYGEPYIIDYPTAIAADNLEPAPNPEVRERLAARRELREVQLPAGIFPSREEWNIPANEGTGAGSTRTLSPAGWEGRAVLVMASLAAVAIAAVVAIRGRTGRRRDA